MGNMGGKNVPICPYGHMGVNLGEYGRIWADMGTFSNMGYGPIFFKVAHISDMGAHISIWAPNLNNGGWGRSPKIMPKTASHPGKGEQAVHVGPEPVLRKPCSGATWGAKFYNFHARVLHKLPSIPSLLN